MGVGRALQVTACGGGADPGCHHGPPGSCKLFPGTVSERPKDHVSKTCVGATPPWVQIPPVPPQGDSRNSVKRFTELVKPGEGPQGCPGGLRHVSGHCLHLTDAAVVAVQLPSPKAAPRPGAASRVSRVGACSYRRDELQATITARSEALIARSGTVRPAAWSFRPESEYLASIATFRPAGDAQTRMGRPAPSPRKQARWPSSV